MAEQAQQEPTMEEILSSIRKIIADDDQQVGSEAAVSENVVEVGDANDDAFDELELAPEEITQTIPQTEDEVLEAISQVETDNDVFDPISSFDDLADEPSLDPIEDSFEAVDGFDSFEEVDLGAEPEPINAVTESFDEIEAAFATDSQPEPEFETLEETPTMPTAPLAATQTADAAAGSLGKLLSKVEFGEEAGGNNTIEGVVREMLRPMLKEWLDDNLPAIVEKQVEAEVQRIARMAR